MNGTSEYGMMRFEASLPAAGNLYKITVLSHSVEDSQIVPNSGPTQDFVFFYDAYEDAVVMLGERSETERPRVRPGIGYNPANGETKVPATSSLSLWFDEEIQKGSGSVRLCLNSNTRATDPSSCRPARFEDGSPVIMDVQSAIIAGRKVEVKPPQSIGIGQHVYVNISAGAFKSVSGSPMEAIDGADYTFAIEDKDVVSPHVQMFAGTDVSFGLVSILFSEAVQASGDGAVSVSDLSKDADMTELAMSIEGNYIRLGGAWQPGVSYEVSIGSAGSPDGYIADLAGNIVEESALQMRFSISADVDAPTVQVLPDHAEKGRMDLYNAFVLDFSEVVERGSRGTLTVKASDGTPCVGSCAEGESVLSVDVVEIPLLTVTSGNRLHSRAIIDTAPPESPSDVYDEGRAAYKKKLMPNLHYSLSVSQGAFQDLAGNRLESLADFSDYSIQGALQRDTNPPLPMAADFGQQQPSPNPFFVADSIDIYFSESVGFVAEAESGKAVRLIGSSGGKFCTEGHGECLASTECSHDCGYAPADNHIEVPDAAMSVSGCKVTIVGLTSMPLQPGKGYKIVVDVGKFVDSSGLGNNEFHGDAGGVAIVFRASYGLDTTGPSHVTTWPEDGSTMLPCSTAFSITFNEVVQHGTGDIRVGFDPTDALPSSACHFEGTTMTCVPTKLLMQNAAYSITYDAEAVLDVAGNPSSQVLDGVSSQMRFTTFDLDYSRPLLLPEASPSPGAQAVARGSTLIMTFNEVVQAGDGAFVLRSLSSQDETTIDVSSESQVVFDGTSVYVAPGILQPGETYILGTNATGVVADAVGQPAAHLDEILHFTVAPADEADPQLFQHLPGAAVDMDPASVSSDIVLFFSEAVQASSADGSPNAVYISQGGSITRIPVDNSEPGEGSVMMFGTEVRVRPFRNMQYGTFVSISVPKGAFEDLSGRPAPAIDIKYSTVSSTFVLTRNAAGSDVLLREGAVFYAGTSGFRMFGGILDDECLSLADAWSSADGSKWERLEGVHSASAGAELPRVAYAASVTDGYGCLLLLGAECREAAASRQHRLWRTCDGGLAWQLLQSPMTLPLDGSADVAGGSAQQLSMFPATWEGHAIVIVGAWQLIIVDAAREAAPGPGVWRFKDADMKYVQRVAVGPLPFGKRRNPQLVATSHHTMYLLGGHTCSDDLCLNGIVHSDIWESTDFGETWNCKTVRHTVAADANSEVGRFPAVAMTGDDTIYLIGGQLPGSLEGSMNVYTSVNADPDISFDGDPYMKHPPKEGTVSRKMKYYVYFREGIQASSDAIQLVEMPETGRSPDVASVRVPVSVTVEQQVLIAQPLTDLMPGKRYSVKVVPDAVADIAGHRGKSLLAVSSWVKVMDDDVPPGVVSVFPQGVGASPSTSVALTFTEAVQKGEGALTLTGTRTGHRLHLDVNVADVVSERVFFRLPPGERLRWGEVYQMAVPDGLVVDEADNSNVAGNVGAFQVSGVDYSNFTVQEVSALLLDTNVLSEAVSDDDKAPARLTASFPADGATDVRQGNFILTLFFSGAVDLAELVTIVVDSESGMQKTLIINRKARRVTSSETTSASSIQDLSEKVELVRHEKLKCLRVTLPKQVLQEGRCLDGHLFTVTVMNASVVDSAGYGIGNLRTSFRCLPNLDVSAPTVLAKLPSETALGGVNKLTFFFSQNIVLGSGDIVIRSVTGSANFVVPLDEKRQATVVGNKLVLSVAHATGVTAGQYVIEVPAQAVRSADVGSLPIGVPVDSRQLQEYTWAVTVIRTDIIKPVLIHRQPLSELEPAYSLPTTASILLTFSEPLQAGDGAVRLQARLSRTSIVIPARDTSVIAQKVFISPPGGLLPGEVYDISIDANAFMDEQMNPYEGDSGYMLSTRPAMRFQKISDLNFAGQRRYRSGIIVDSKNDIVIFGGKSAEVQGAGNGTGEPVVLQDIWRLPTARATHCASSDQVGDATCSSATCKIHGAEKSPSLGTQMIERIVWREPSASGMGCMRQADGFTASSLGQTVMTREQRCPCPLCVEPPDLPSSVHSVKEGWLLDYTFVSPFQGSRPMYCEEGYIPNASFQCIVESKWLASFQKPYPACLQKSCTTSPVSGNATTLLGFYEPECEAVDEGRPLKNGATCTPKCAPGYAANDVFTCNFGDWQTTDCLPLKCPLPNASSNLVFLCELEGGQMPLSAECSLLCNAGYRMANETQVSCLADPTSPPATPPELTRLPLCKPSMCTPYEYTDYTTLDFTGAALGSTATGACHSGFNRTGIDMITCLPEKNTPGEEEVHWLDADGRRAAPMCLPNGLFAKPFILVRHSIDISFDLGPDVTLVELCQNETFLETLQSGIAVAMTEMASIELEVSSVVAFKVDRCLPYRRLRQLSTAVKTNATLTYDVKLTDENIARRIRDNLQEPDNVLSFVANFTSALELQAPVGVVVRCLAVGHASVIINYVSAPISSSNSSSTWAPTPSVPPALPTRAPQIPIDDSVLIVIGSILCVMLGLVLICLVKNMYKLQFAKAEQKQNSSDGSMFKYHNANIL
eukprot:TRINITY_DN22287_c0_g1_i1.p1 TRINITY_DN22287_c0_g1~~TRINITY_DN22287_c0_g1_i1.p1  ORF type:complete len:2761 (+),score=392.65 TRINITY_DN22287_c0_g1_i1:722-8284(+)